jgi:hypothetical protein
MAAAVLAARLRIAVGPEPGFLAMAAIFKLSVLERLSDDAPVLA